MGDETEKQTETQTTIPKVGIFIMKTKPIITILVSIALLANICINGQTTSVAVTTLSNCQTQIVTLLAEVETPVSYILATNQIVSITSILYPTTVNNIVTISIVSGNRITNNFSLPNNSLQLPITFTGGTSILVGTPLGSGDPIAVTLTILTPSTNTVTYTPANSVVIPSDAKGNVQILLESSSDMVNWIPSEAGTYGSTYSNRFFRIRALAQ